MVNDLYIHLHPPEECESTALGLDYPGIMIVTGLYWNTDDDWFLVSLLKRYHITVSYVYREHTG
jgi:hypothetical protein